MAPNLEMKEPDLPVMWNPDAPTLGGLVVPDKHNQPAAINPKPHRPGHRPDERSRLGNLLQGAAGHGFGEREWNAFCSIGEGQGLGKQDDQMGLRR